MPKEILAAGRGEEGLGVTAANLFAAAGTGFAVIHDEPFFSIIYQEGEFVGEVVDATPERLEEAHRLASRYNLVINRMSRSGSSAVLILTEKGNATH